MLLNPNRIENPQQVSPGSVEAQDPFDHPIPGQSLTEEPGKHVFEKPPEITDVDDAVEYVVGKISENPEAIEKFEKLMMTGMPIESIVNTISFSGFAEGKWNPDIAELMKPPLSAFFIILAREENIPAVMFNSGDSEILPDDQVMASMREGNPEAFEALQQQAQMDAMPSPPMSERSFMEMEEGGLPMEEGGLPMENESLPMGNENINMEGMI